MWSHLFKCEYSLFRFILHNMLHLKSDQYLHSLLHLFHLIGLEAC